MQAVFKTVAQVAPSRASVLITGETGTGKELIAAAIHERSPRATGPFVKLHCAALAETLLESELFGHERGAFTGAAGAPRRPLRAGRRRHAVPRRDRRDLAGDAGEAAALPAGARVRARGRQRDDQRRRARHRRDQPRPASRWSREGQFREDLYYRLNVVTLEMPPLRERAADIPLLAGALPAQVRRRRTARRSTASPTRRSSASPATTGRATCASWRTSSSARSCCAQTAQVTVAELPPQLVPAKARGRPADPRRDDGRDRALRDHEDARGDRRLDQPGRRDARHQRAQDPVQAARVRERAQVGAPVRATEDDK